MTSWQVSSIVHGEQFKQLLLPDASSSDGQNYVAKYYEFNNWAQIKMKGIDKGCIWNLASSYFYLLLLVNT